MKGDPAYGEAVQRLQIRECSHDDIDFFNSRVVNSAENSEGVDMNLNTNGRAAAIVATNRMREVLNQHKVYSQGNGCRHVLRMGHKQLSLDERRCLLDLNVVSTQQSLPGTILLFEGMPVILRSRDHKRFPGDCTEDPHHDLSSRSSLYHVCCGRIST